MKSPTDDAPAFLTSPGMTAGDASRRTGLAAREIAETLDESLRCQLGQLVQADVHTHNAALTAAHIEKNVLFFQLSAWGATWPLAIAHWQRKRRNALPPKPSTGAAAQ